ncbi:uncharacterized protein MYCGRDRAFT_94247 [Zymoseptoria tritici IPO323]|uniref:Uncharacterized protein n=1 Tax=Zymoseptoria tritici (strain CBS 115943 / IPO323) TaxID=336722 RepID=F9XGH3_ZYMTI|nr:uncharacterized protein MYCGRDRAFT_94247 [Zymoseptoria tritici IPO323]EGP86266.1 hypothetical protein MYCGRDRAFT_94247 [Zymoseptoria tritici IPO323]
MLSADWDAEMAAGGKPLVILKKHTAAANSMLKAYKDVKMAHIEAIAPTATAPNEVEKQTMSLGQHDCTDRTTGDENLEANEVVAPSGRRFFRAKRTDWAKGDETEERSGAENVAGVRLYKGSQKLKALQEAAESAKIEASAQGDARGEDDARTVEESDDLMTDSDPENRGMTGAS